MWSRELPSTAEAPGYSRDEVVAEITSFYKFLAKLYIPSEAFIYPPPGGWPEITSQRLSCLGKTDTAIDLIRHLPFIGPIYEKGVDLRIYELWTQTSAVHYISERFYNGHGGIGPTYESSVPEDWQSIIPPHVVTLAVPNSGQDGEWAFLDTERGTITICDFQEMGGNRYERDFPGELWRGYPTYVPKTFFDHLKKKYSSLDLFPRNDHKIGQTSKSIAGGGDPYEADEPLRNIFREHGWPTANYRKEECMKKVKEFDKQKAADRMKKRDALMASWSRSDE